MACSSVMPLCMSITLTLTLALTLTLTLTLTPHACRSSLPSKVCQRVVCGR